MFADFTLAAGQNAFSLTILPASSLKHTMLYSVMNATKAKLSIVKNSLRNGQICWPHGSIVVDENARSSDH